MNADPDADLRPAPPDRTEDELWRACKEQGSTAARELLFNLHAPFAKGVVRRNWLELAKGEVEFGELCQLAYAGLLEAIDHFRPELGVPFRGYALKRISGSVRDGLAKLTEVREQISFRARLRRERARSLAEDSSRDLSGRPALDALADLAVGLAIGLMLEQTNLYIEDDQPDAHADAYQTLAWKQVLARVAGEVQALSERERTIITWHYVEGMTFDQIGRALSVTKGRVSQLHRTAIATLRKRMPGANPFRLER